MNFDVYIFIKIIYLQEYKKCDSIYNILLMYKIQVRKEVPMTNEGSVRQQEQHSMKKHRINWHHAMYEVLHIELEEYLEHLQLHHYLHLIHHKTITI